MLHGRATIINVCYNKANVVREAFRKLKSKHIEFPQRNFHEEFLQKVSLKRVSKRVSAKSLLIKFSNKVQERVSSEGINKECQQSVSMKYVNKVCQQSVSTKCINKEC